MGGGLLQGELHPPLPVVFILPSPLRRSHEIVVTNCTLCLAHLGVEVGRRQHRSRWEAH